MNAVLSNPQHPEYGQVTIPLPIPYEEYEHCMKQLEPLEIGHATARDCRVDEIIGVYSVLDRLAGSDVNVDELDFLARSVERYWGDESAKFEAMVYKLDIKDIESMINMSFCCEQATIITDFSDLNKLGKDHYMDTHGNSAPVGVLDKLDGEKLIRELIVTGTGTVTPFGVVYDNGFKLSQSYRGRAFPQYAYAPSIIDLKIITGSENEDTFLQLPMPNARLERMLERGGVAADRPAFFETDAERCPDTILDVIEDELNEFDRDKLLRMNEFCHAIGGLSNDDLKKLAAAVLYAEPEYSCQIRQLAENLDLFDFIPDIKTPEDYGKYMIQQSGHFDFDENLIGFYDYKGYGEQRIASESGTFNEMGYISYHGTLSLEELMMEEPSEQAPVQGQAMGGLT